MTIEQSTHLHRSGSLSSLNDDMHSNDPVKRKMTILDTTSTLSTTIEDDNPLKKLNNELKHITINYLNDHLYDFIIQYTSLILLPREVRRHHLNNSWLADEKILYQIKSYDFDRSNKSNDYLTIIKYVSDDVTQNRYRRYTDGNKQNVRKNRELQILTSCQDDLHIRSLGLLSFCNFYFD